MATESGGWTVAAPSPEALAAARVALGLAADAPVALGLVRDQHRRELGRVRGLVDI